MNILKKYSLFILLVIGILITPVWTILTSAQTPNTLQTQLIEYQQGDTVLEGYLAYNSSQTGKRPGVLVVHEWKGLDEYTKSRTEQLARLGYVAFAADIYGKGIRPQTAEEARTQATLYRSNRALLRERVNAALAELRKQPQTDPQNLAAIGYCFGGTTVLELARSGADIDGVVSFHGGLDSPNPQDGKQIKSKVLVLHGADDPLVSPEDIMAFEKEMRNGNVDWQMISYGRTVHSFTNPKAGNDPSKGTAYNPDSDRRSFEAMKLFFNEIF
ncbi:dienelactone hydrolase family protein [Planktothrix mougeotii]|uniref:Dienelactone hydrolase family protein n=1 Tax=Planktothrix mougeotii LEGE 06226 TaxID=1828728 RepID=A0ABR9UAS9_9CYAN|nr:dienelactone hydrolase family protein [Planktothrix mougeotii]MBE9143291.1 dienelactone hydrolase family protein [Planktothrix mougeotii LEGE 06226]